LLVRLARTGKPLARSVPRQPRCLARAPETVLLWLIAAEP